MTKKSKEVKAPLGNMISSSKSLKDKHIPLYEFLMFDPIYRKMSANAKMLYSFLRNKLPYFEKVTESYEQGIEGTKSYRDDNDYIYCLADNTELEYILDVAESTLIRVKDELASYGLLLEVPVKDRANRLYVLEPAQVAEKWTHIEEIKKLRKEKQLKNKEKAAKKQQAKISKPGNLQNASYGNLQNESYRNLQNESKTKSNISKSNLISKIQSNLSKSELPEMIQTVLLQRVDKIDENKLNIIIYLYDAYKTSVTENQFRVVLVNVLSAKVKSSFKGLLEKSLKTEIAAALESQTNTTRKENGLSEAVKQQLAEEQEQSKQEAQSSYTDMSLDHLNELLNTFNELAERGNTSAIEQLAKIETEIASRLQVTGVM